MTVVIVVGGGRLLNLLLLSSQHTFKNDIIHSSFDTKTVEVHIKHINECGSIYDDEMVILCTAKASGDYGNDYDNYGNDYVNNYSYINNNNIYAIYIISYLQIGYRRW